MQVENPYALLFSKTQALPTLIQGISGRTGRKHSRLMRDYGTKVVAGVVNSNSQSGLTNALDGVPLFHSCKDAVQNTGALASVIMVQPFDVLAAIEDALIGGIKVIVTVTEGMPVKDACIAKQLVEQYRACWIGASTPGIAAPGHYKLGFIPSVSLSPGSVGIMAKSGTLSYEANLRLVQNGLGQSVWVGVGGDTVKGTRFSDLLPYFENDMNTKVLGLIGEIGGTEEEDFAEAVLASKFSKPIVAIIAGKHAKEGVVMGHAGAVMSGYKGTAKSKICALQNAGIQIGTTIDSFVELIKKNCNQVQS